MPHLAIFDVDHTITRRSTGRRLVQSGIRHGLFTAGSLLSLPYHYLRYRAGKIDLSRATSALGRLQGHSRAELKAIAAECYRERVVGDIMPASEAAVACHRSEGNLIVLATSSLCLIVAPLGEHLGADHVLATELEYRDDIATGRLATGPCFGEEKRRRVHELAGLLRERLEDAWFYSDSHLDLPLFEAVGHPVAVNPDRRLRRIAVERGWQILRFR